MGNTEFRVDKWWPVIALVGEADSAVKYRGYFNSRSLWAEKRRQDWFEDVLGLPVFRFVDSEVRLTPEAFLERWTRKPNERPRNFGYHLTALRSFNDHRPARAGHGNGCGTEMVLRGRNLPDSGQICASGQSR